MTVDRQYSVCLPSRGGQAESGDSGTWEICFAARWLTCTKNGYRYPHSRDHCEATSPMSILNKLQFEYGCSHHRTPRAHSPLPSAVYILAAQPSEVWHLLWQSLSVCLSDGVCPSVTLVSHALTVKDIEICFVPYDRLQRGVSSFWRTNCAIPK